MSAAAAAVSRQAMAPRVLNLVQTCQSRVRILVPLDLRLQERGLPAADEDTSIPATAKKVAI